VPKDAKLGGLGSATAQRAELLLWERNADHLLQTIRTEGNDDFEGQSFFMPSALYAAWAQTLRGDPGAARAAFDSALVRLDPALRKAKDDWRIHVARGLALAGLGRRSEALREARWLETSVLYKTDAFEGTELAEGRARILAQAGEA